MRTLSALGPVKAACRELAAAGSVGFVPTMGALHAGHLSLVRRAAAECDHVVVSIFVNPLQFGAGEDFAAYPRDPEGDARLLAAEGVTLLALLQRDEMYPPGFATTVTQPSLTTVLEGSARPGHFDGVLTVVAKLLNIVGARRAYFGRKDFQQTVVVGRLIADLDLPVQLVVCDTCRAADGLALSSRNAYLDAAQRARGLSLVAALGEAERLFEAGERHASRLEAAMAAVLSRALGHAPDYAAVVTPELGRREVARPGDVAVVAARVGPTRLLDNHVLGAKLGPFSPDTRTCSAS